MYEGLYRLFDDVTPLKGKDCGRLCGAACCRGDEKTGMLLFPGETTSLDVVGSAGRRLAVCRGFCDRGERPLSCRIFPLFPAVLPDGGIEVLPDARGFSVCPLVRRYQDVRFSAKFVGRVRLCGQILSRDPACADFLKEITEEIRSLELLRGSLG